MSIFLPQNGPDALTNQDQSAPYTVARVILRADGDVHIAFRGVRSIYATIKNLREFFSNPIEFILETSQSYKSSTTLINRKRVGLNNILGLTLAEVTSDKQVICEFPEIFGCLFANVSTSKELNAPLNMNNFRYETVLSDEKAYLLRYYLELTSSLKPEIKIKNNINLRNEIQAEIVRQAINVYLEADEQKENALSSLSEKISVVETEEVLKNTTVDENEYLSVKETAIALKLNEQTVRNYFHEGRFKKAYQDKRNRIFIAKNEIPEKWDLRKDRKRNEANKDPEKGFSRLVKASPAEAVKKRAIEMKLFTPEVADYIRTQGELEYYAKRSYHQITLCGRPAIVIDVNPDYVSASDNISNRERMENGNPPVVPHRDKEDAVFDVHHVGQLASSPFATVPHFDHIGEVLTTYFHPGGHNTNLHTKEFELQKKNFWKAFLAEYDKAGGDFRKIPYLNHRIRK